MDQRDVREKPRKAYVPPTITRVHLDPVNELLMGTAPCFADVTVCGPAIC